MCLIHNYSSKLIHVQMNGNQLYIYTKTESDKFFFLQKIFPLFYSKHHLTTWLVYWGRERGTLTHALSPTNGHENAESSNRLRLSQSLERSELTQEPVPSPPDAPVLNPFNTDPLEQIDLTHDSDKETSESNLPPILVRPAILRTLIPTEFFGCSTLPPLEITILPPKPPIWDESKIEHINFNDHENNPILPLTGVDWSNKCQALRFYLNQKQLPPQRRSPIFATLTKVLYSGNTDMCSESRSREREF